MAAARYEIVGLLPGAVEMKHLLLQMRVFVTLDLVEGFRLVPPDTTERETE